LHGADSTLEIFADRSEPGHSPAAAAAAIDVVVKCVCYVKSGDIELLHNQVELKFREFIIMKSFKKIFIYYNF